MQSQFRACSIRVTCNINFSAWTWFYHSSPWVREMTLLKHKSLLSTVLTLLYFNGYLWDKGFLVLFCFVSFGCFNKVQGFSFFYFFYPHMTHFTSLCSSHPSAPLSPSPLSSAFKTTVCHRSSWKFKKMSYRILGNIIYMHKILNCFQRCILLLTPPVRIALPAVQ